MSKNTGGMTDAEFEEYLAAKAEWEHPEETGAAPEFIVKEGSPEPAAPGKLLMLPPTFMDADWDEVDTERLPDFVQVEGGLPLLYKGESHMMFGAGGTGKSLCAARMLLEIVRSGAIAIAVDYESNKRTLRLRLKALGATKQEAARIAYWKPVGSLMPKMPARVQLDTFLGGYQGVFILMDSVAVACQTAGFDDEKNPQYNFWFDKVVEPWTHAGHTSLLIDHVGHISEERKNGNIAARGASSKADRVSGASYYFEQRVAWSKLVSGWGRLTTFKCREGNRAKGSIAAEIRVTTGDGNIAIDFISPKPLEKSDAGLTIRSWYQDAVSDFLATQTAPVSGNTVSQFISAQGKSKQYADEALKVLVEKGFVSRDVKEGRQAIYYKFVKAWPKGSETGV